MKGGEIMDITPEQLQKADLGKLLDIFLKSGQELENLNALLSVVKTEMAARLDAEGVKGKPDVNGYSIQKISYPKFSPTIEQAKELAATKIVPSEEVIDSQALKRLHDSGVKIPNTTFVTFIKVEDLSKPKPIRKPKEAAE